MASVPATGSDREQVHSWAPAVRPYGGASWEGQVSRGTKHKSDPSSCLCDLAGEIPCAPPQFSHLWVGLIHFPSLIRRVCRAGPTKSRTKPHLRNLGGRWLYLGSPFTGRTRLCWDLSPAPRAISIGQLLQQRPGQELCLPCRSGLGPRVGFLPAALLMARVSPRPARAPFPGDT